jgi:hypothetical protein
MSYKNVSNLPNTYFYSYTEPGQLQKHGAWTQDDHCQFLAHVEHFGGWRVPMLKLLSGSTSDESSVNCKMGRISRKRLSSCSCPFVPEGTPRVEVTTRSTFGEGGAGYIEVPGSAQKQKNKEAKVKEEGRAEIQDLGGGCSEVEYMEKLPMGKRI